ncbi:MAG: tetratricopeptide repeat protein [Oligoflexia bacterium]|nr:tetratricopeptide repeat protein [Oligoflexia bacterium]
MKKQIMKVIYLIILGIFLVSCASESTKNEKNYKEDIIQPQTQNKIVIEESEYDYLKDNYNYNNNSNNIKEKDSNIANILDRETLYKYSTGSLEEFIKDPKSDPFIKTFSLCYLKKFIDARKEITQLYWEYKKYPTYWNLIGNCLLLEGDLAKARLYYNKALELDANYTPALNNLGILYLKEKREQKALAAFIKASKSSLFTITPMYNLANLYTKYGLIEKALPVFETFYANDVASNGIYFPELSLNYSYVLMLSGQEHRAKEIFNTIDFNKIKEDPKLEKIYYEIRNYISN